MVRASLVIAFVVSLVSLGACQDAKPRPEPVPDDEAAELLESTPWLDRAPRTERDVIHLYVFQDGEGIYFIGNAYKATLELIKYWLDGNRVEMRFLDENKAYKTKYRIEKYRGEIFDYKLTLDKSPRGPKVYYGFDSNRAHELPPLVTRIMELAATP
jgi:hypothetical protein